MKRIAIILLCALVVLSSCSKSEDDKTVRIATKPMTEQYILGEMLGLLVEDAGYTPVITKGIGGGTSNIQPAMEKGDFDLYPEYTSSGWILVLGHKAKELPDDELFVHRQAQYTVAVRGEIAREHGLEKTSDLAAVAPSLTFGGNPDYLERADGYPALCDTYGLDFGDVRDIDIGLKYTALQNGDIDVTNAYTTDAQLANPSVDAVTLLDDKNLQVNYFCSTVVRKDALERCPGLEAALMKMDGLISDSEMAHMNYLVEVEGQDEKVVAKAFLEEKGII